MDQLNCSNRIEYLQNYQVRLHNEIKQKNKTYQREERLFRTY